LREFRWFITALAVAMSIASLAGFAGNSLAQESSGRSEPAALIQHDVAPVVIDGEQIFAVPGISALPAKTRAHNISQRIIDIAEGSSRPPVINVRDTEFGRAVIVDGVEVMTVTSLDAEVAALDIPPLADVISDAINQAVRGYRERRSSEGLIRSATSALLWTVALAAFLSGIYFGIRFLRARVQHRVRTRIKDIEASTSQIVRADAIVSAITAVLWIVSLFLTFIAVYYYLTQVLMSFAATRGLARILLDYFLGPISALFRAILAEIPDLITIVFIAVATAYLIRFIRLIFVNVERGRLEVEGFEAHWIWPTYRIVKFGIILFAVVVAYPYIPGSGTAAFQGVTIFLGVLLSFGSSSVISNLLAGLFVIYRRSVNLGDLIGIGGVIGKIEAINIFERRTSWSACPTPSFSARSSRTTLAMVTAAVCSSIRPSGSAMRSHSARSRRC